jgi:hypothetical protein
MANLIRQGDLLFIPQYSIDTNTDYLQRAKVADGVIREGEATGHHHRVEVLTDAEVFRPSWGDAIVKVSERGVSIVHEEHGTVHLEANTTYTVHVAREFDYTARAARPVWD